MTSTKVYHQQHPSEESTRNGTEPAEKTIPFLRLVSVIHLSETYRLFLWYFFAFCVCSRIEQSGFLICYNSNVLESAIILTPPSLTNSLKNNNHRCLVDMLSENDNVISFCPGSIKNGQIALGRIVVHDRTKVENEILPRYFNHSSFASLRRQLNYFSFTRVGKGRQKGATYCNGSVIEIEDILHLRRRSTTISSTVHGADADDGGTTTSMLLSAGKNHRREGNVTLPTIRNEIQFSKKMGLLAMNYSPSKIKQTLSVPCSSSSRFDFVNQNLIKNNHSDISNRRTNKSNNGAVPNKLLVSLDLTHSPSHEFSSHNCLINSSDGIYHAQQNLTYSEDPDVLAGCRALLCFSHGLHSLTV